MSQHPNDQAITAYENGELAEPDTLALEAHLEVCRSCRERLAGDTAWAEASWDQLQSAIRQPRQSWFERRLAALGVAESTASLVATSPAFRPAWVVSVFIVLVATAAASSVVTSQQLGLLPFLAVAPLVPILGVAVSYASPRDPVYVITMLTPNGGLKLLLQRTLAVTALSMLLAVVPGVIFMPADISLAWLLPALATTSCTLALGTLVALPIASAIVGAAWLVILGAATVWETPDRILHPIPYLLVVVVATVIFAASHKRQAREPLR